MKWTVPAVSPQVVSISAALTEQLPSAGHAAPAWGLSQGDIFFVWLLFLNSFGESVFSVSGRSLYGLSPWSVPS